MMNIKKMMLLIMVVVSIGMRMNMLNAQNFKAIKIGKQIWMAENLNIKVPGSWCYDLKPGMAEKYGRLYTWSAAMKACPKGWHIPSDAEWTTLTNYLGGEDQAGKALKLGGKSGFNAKLGGLCDGHDFRLLGFYGTFWTSTRYNNSQAWYRYVTSQNDYVIRTFFRMDYGFCVRCIKN
ncbi:MAG: FISUMP domain-containing protein [Bacteroidota bacterium]|nr:FISUMP domain-containing protein [Bacteroidota bacterium]MDP4275154.1 FISUMP domain-containing protein [Bacteroidota bacterium]